MAATYTTENPTDKDLVRLLINDVGGNSGTDFLFEDGEIASFLLMEGGSIYAAAATALRAVAGNEAQVSKKIKFLELSTDGPAVAKSMMDLADKLDKKADGIGDGSYGFEIVDMSTSCSERDLILREYGL